MGDSYSTISLFSGGGFLDLGFMNQGFQIVHAIESHQAFVDCYDYGIKNYVKKSKKEIFVKGAITANKIEKASDATSESVQSNLRKNYGNSIGLIGGPPCQDFSVGGKNKGITGDRGRLIFTYLEIVNKVNPLFIFFENVAGLLNTKSHQLGFLNLKEELEKNYHLQYDVLNALNYGVPQDRARLTMVGFRKDVVRRLVKNNYKIIIETPTADDEPVFRWPSKIFKNPKNIEWPKQWQFGSKAAPEPLCIPEKYTQLYVQHAFRNLTESSPNQKECFIPYSKKFKEIQEGDTYRKSFKRLHRFRYSPTVAYGNNEVHLHPTEARRLTVREALRLQSVPDSYALPSEISLTDKFKLISNGVPVKKAELIAKEIKRTLDNYYATF
jgi:DNA (cytosine-5)-methyltransferase 1